MSSSKSQDLPPSSQPPPYVPVILDNTYVLAFLDTGAHISLISADFYYSIPEGQRSPLHKVTTLASSVTGESLDTIGSATATLHIGSKTISHQFYIARNICHTCILGWNFFTEHGASISSLTSTFYIQGSAIPLVDHRQYQVPRRCNVSLVGKATLPQMSESHVHGRLISQQADMSPRDYDGFFEPSIDEHHQVAGARCLFRPQDGLILVRLINPTSETIELPSNTLLGQFYSITGHEDEEYALVDKVVAGTEPQQQSEVCNMLSTADLTEQEYNQAQELLHRYHDVFSSSTNDIGQTGMIHHEIHTTTDRPVHQRAYRTSPAMRLEIEQQVNNLLDRGIIQHSFSPWSSPIVMVKKKDNSFRFCIDYRALNAVTVKDSHPIPRQDDTLDALSSSSYFSVIDLSSGYWQVPLHPDSKEKTAFTTGTGLYEFSVMPFGLVNAPMTFQRLMEHVLRGLHWSTCLVYLDDCIILGRDFPSHISNLQEVLQRFRDAGLKLKMSKCQFFKKQVNYLGHVISSSGVRPDPSNISKVSAWSRPKNATQIRSFIGLASFYRRFIPSFSKIAAPLTRLTQKKVQFLWTEECESAFNTLKEALTNPPILAYPDFNSSFRLATDASQDAIGAVLTQVHDGKERVVAYYSQKLNNTQQKWSTYDRELWAVVASVRHFRHYLRGQEFDVITDHRPLLSFNKIPIQDEASGRRARWVIELSAYTFTIMHRQGRSHQNADAMSRLPTQQPSGIQHPSSNLERHPPFSQPRCNVVETQPVTKDSPGGHKPVSSALTDQADQESKFTLANHLNQIKYHQRNDKDLQKIIEYVCSGHHPSVRFIRRQPPSLRRLLWQFPRFTIENEIIYRKKEDHFGNVTLQAVVPTSMVPEILDQLHGNAAAGHFGAKRCIQRAEAMCYWPSMSRDIHEHCNTCTACESIRMPNPKHQAPLQNITSDHPLQLVFADIAELPTSKNGYRYMLVAVDHFSKYINIYPMKDQTARTVAKHLFDDYIKEHGVPEAIHTDQGRQFESKIVQDLCRKLGIRKSRSSPYHPQGAGLVERANRVIKEQLAKYMAHQGGEWDTHIPLLQIAYNSSVHSSTGLTPYYIMHGREARLPANLTCPVISAPYNSAEEYVADVCGRLRKAFNFVQQNLRQAQERQKKDYDTSSRMVQYKPGDTVWLHDPVIARNKLDPNWRGPFTVISSSLDGLNYKIVDDKKKEKLVHHNRLKLFRSKASLEGSRHPAPVRKPSAPRSNSLIPPMGKANPATIEVFPSARQPADHQGHQSPNRNRDQPTRQATADQSISHQRQDSSVQPSWAEQSNQPSTSRSSTQSRDGPPDQPSWSDRPNQPSTSRPSTQSRDGPSDQPSWSDRPNHLGDTYSRESTDQPLWSAQSSSPDQYLGPGSADTHTQTPIEGNQPTSTRFSTTPRTTSSAETQAETRAETQDETRAETQASSSAPGDSTTVGQEPSRDSKQSRYGRRIREPQRFKDYQKWKK